MISFFTSLKPFRGTTAVQQRNALRSWRATMPNCEIIVFGAVEGGDDLLAEMKATYRPDIACNQFGTPLIGAIFAEAQESARHSTLCYINGDIILLPDFAAAIARLARWRSFAAVGQRWNVDWEEPINFGAAKWQEMLRAAVAKRGRQHDQVAMDFFAFRRGAVGSLPAFAVGRPAWDNYLIRHLLQRHIPIVDLSRVVKPIHQNHGYAHVAHSRGAAWEGPEADQNRVLAEQQLEGFTRRYYTIGDARWIMLDRYIVPAISPRRAWRRLRTIISRPAHDDSGAVLHVSYGPYLDLMPGWYRADLKFTVAAAGTARPPSAHRLGVEVVSGPYLIWFHAIEAAELADGKLSFTFRVSEELAKAMPVRKVEFRLCTDGRLTLTMTEMTVAGAAPPANGISEFDWLPMLAIGKAGRFQARDEAQPFSGSAVCARRGIRSHVVHGPYIALPPGRYDAVFILDIDTARWRAWAKLTPPIVLDVAINGGTHCLARMPVSPRESGPLTVTLPVEVPAASEAGGKAPQLEFRVRSSGALNFSVVSLHVKPSVAYAAVS